MGGIGEFIFSGGLSSIFPDKKKPKSPGKPPPPPGQDPEALAAAEEASRKEREKQSKKQNRRKTILTSPKGLQDEETPLGPKTLLGALGGAKK